MLYYYIQDPFDLRSFNGRFILLSIILDIAWEGGDDGTFYNTAQMRFARVFFFLNFFFYPITSERQMGFDNNET